MYEKLVLFGRILARSITKLDILRVQHALIVELGNLMKQRAHLIIKDRIWVPEYLVDGEAIRGHYTKAFYNDSACSRCDYRAERHCSMCDTCEAYRGKVKLYAKKHISGIDYLGVPIGDKHNFERKTGLLFEELKIYDRRVDAPFEYPVKFTLDLYDYQQTAVETFLKKKYGMLEAPPRTGKTAMALFIAIALGQRTLVLANQHEFLSQFLDHIHGNEKEGIPKCTNLPELEKKYKKKLYGFVKKGEPIEDYQIMVCTYQQFISETRGMERLKVLMPHVGTIAIDEVHKSAADKFSQVVSKFPAKYKFGVTATVDRKDKKDILVKHILGPVVARSSRESLTPTVYIHETGFVPKRRYASGPRAWVFAMQALARDTKRNKLILKQVMADLKNGHNIVIPVMFKKHALELYAKINKMYGKKICEMFVGGGGSGNKDKRKQILADAKSGKIRVIVGIRSMLQLGLNVPAWSAIYTISPISNSPNYRQETSRVRTPMEGKRPPIIRLFVDEELGQSWGCAKNCVMHLKSFGYKFSEKPEQKEMQEKLRKAAASSRRDADPDSDYKPSRTFSSKPKQEVIKSLL